MNQVSYNQPTASPTPKVAAAGLAGVVVTAVVALCNIFGIVIPENVSGAALTLVAAVTTIVSFVSAYLKKDKKPVLAVREIQRRV